MHSDLWRPMSPPGTNASAPLPTASSSPAPLLSSGRGSVSPRDQNRSTVPSLGGAISPVREDGGTTQGAFHCIELTACFRRSMRPFIHTDPTPHSAWQTRATCLPCDVLAWRPRTASFGHRFDPMPAAKTRALGTFPDRPSRPSPNFRGRAAVVRISGSTVCDGLARPFPTCLAAVRGARVRCVPTNFCFPLLRLRVLAPLVFPASFRDLRLAPSPGLATWRKWLGDLALHGAKLRFGGRLGFAYGVVFHTLPNHAVPLTSLSLHRSPSRRFRGQVNLRRSQDHAASTPWRAAYSRDPRCLPSPALPRPPRGALMSRAVTWRFPLRLSAGALSRSTVRAFARPA